MELPEENNEYIYKIIEKDLKYDITKLKQYRVYIKKHIETDLQSETFPYWDIIRVDNEGRIPYVLFFQYIKRVSIVDSGYAICFGKADYDFNEKNVTTGLIKIEILSPTNGLSEECKEMLYAEIYVCVRDIYHRHTHHKESHEMLCPPVKTLDRNEAIKIIPDEYNEKIIKNHIIIKSYYNKSPKQAISDLLRVKGEMIYAQRFIELVNLDDHLKQSFHHAYNSFEDFDKYINAMHEVERSGEMRSLTFAIYLLTAAMVVFTVFMASGIVMPVWECVLLFILLLLVNHLYAKSKI
jgi:hypothetical protein